MSESLRMRVDEGHVAPLNELARRWRADPRAMALGASSRGSIRTAPVSGHASSS